MGPKTYLVLGTEGVHVHHRDKRFEAAIQVFRKKYGGPHCNKDALLKKGAVVLSDSQPTRRQADRYVKRFYNFLWRQV